MKAYDITGITFSRLTVLKRDGSVIHPNGKTSSRWLCLCICGKRTTVTRQKLVDGETKSCGCWRKDKRILHGKSESNTWRTWWHMKQRCENKNNDNFSLYGGRGIRVCERWANFQNFYTDMGERPLGMSIDRINNDGNYEPSNCRWATMKEQSRNTSRNVWIEYNGKRKCLADWEKETGLERNVIHTRIKRGWPIDKALTTKCNKRWAI